MDAQKFWWQSCLYNICHTALGTALTFGSSLRVQGRNNVPSSGPVLLLANHASHVDPVLVALATDRYLSFVAKLEHFQNRFMAWLLRNGGAFPIHRGVGTEAIKETRRRLQQGKAVLIFPEGTRTNHPQGQMQDLKPGIVPIMKGIGVPVVPVGIAGSINMLPRGARVPKLSPIFAPPNDASLSVSVGKPIASNTFAGMPREDVLEELARLIAAEKVRAEEMRKGGLRNRV